MAYAEAFVDDAIRPYLVDGGVATYNPYEKNYARIVKIKFPSDATGSTYGDQAGVIASNAAIESQQTSQTILYAVGAALGLLLLFRVLKLTKLL